MFEKEVKNKDGFVKRVVAGSEEELKEAVKAVKLESAPVSPNIDSSKDANKVVTPDDGTPGGIDYTPVAKATPKKVVEETPKPKGRVKKVVDKVKSKLKK